MKTSQTSVANNSAAPGRSALGASAGQRLPVPPRERKPALAALAVLLILGGALTSAYLVIQSGQRVSAIQIAEPVAAGQRIELSALREVQIGDTGIEFINWSERHKVAAAYASVPLVPGALLTNSMTRPSNASTAGRVVVGLALKPGQVPAAGLRKGQRVSVYAVGASDNNGGIRPGTVLAADAVVQDIGAGEQRARSDVILLDITVLPAEAPQLTQAASAGAVAIAIVPEGTRVTAQAPPRAEQSPRSGETPSAGVTGQPTQPGG
jgi:hypothetical protein